MERSLTIQLFICNLDYFHQIRLDGETNEAIELPFKKSVEEYTEDVKVALELDVEYILTNGMDSTEGIIEIKKQLALNNSKIKLFAKIDNKWSISEIDSYIDVRLLHLFYQTP